MTWHKVDPMNFENIATPKQISHLDFSSPVVKILRDTAFRRFYLKKKFDYHTGGEIITKETDRVLNKMLEILRKISPNSATWLLHGEREYLDPSLHHEIVSRARPAWIIGVFAQGNSDSKHLAMEFFQLYKEWHSNRISLWHMNSLYNINKIKDNLVTSRILENTTRLRWISDLITSEIGHWVDINYPDLKNSWGRSAMLKINENIDELLKNSNSPQFRFSSIALAGLSLDMINELSAPKKELNLENLISSLESDDFGKYPIVKVGDQYLVLNTTDWLFNREHSIIYNLMSKLPSHLSGKLLEDITVATISKVGPEEIYWQSGTHEHSNCGSLEIDFIGKSPNHCFIGECKSSFDPKTNDSIDASYDQKIITKASGQLLKRIYAIQDSGFQGEINGIIVTISDYAGAIWDSAKNEKGLSIFPLKMLILCCSVFHSANDMHLYLSWRHKILSKNFKNADEIELILAFINQQLELPDEASQAGLLLMRSYEVTDKLRLMRLSSLNFHNKKNRDGWIKILNNETHPIFLDDPLLKE